MTDTPCVPATAPETKDQREQRLRKYLKDLRKQTQPTILPLPDDELHRLAKLTIDQQQIWEQDAAACKLLSHHSLPTEALELLLDKHCLCIACPVLPEILAQHSLEAHQRHRALYRILSLTLHLENSPLWRDLALDRGELRIIHSLARAWPYASKEDFHHKVVHILSLPTSVQEIFCALARNADTAHFTRADADKATMLVDTLLSAAQLA